MTKREKRPQKDPKNAKNNDYPVLNDIKNEVLFYL